MTKKTEGQPAGEAGEAGGGDRHHNRSMGFRPDAALRAAIEALAKKERRRPAQLLVLLVEEALKARGCWPPAEPPAS